MDSLSSAYISLHKTGLHRVLSFSRGLQYWSLACHSLWRSKKDVNRLWVSGRKRNKLEGKENVSELQARKLDFCNMRCVVCMVEGWKNVAESAQLYHIYFVIGLGMQCTKLVSFGKLKCLAIWWLFVAVNNLKEYEFHLQNKHRCQLSFIETPKKCSMAKGMI